MSKTRSMAVLAAALLAALLAACGGGSGDAPVAGGPPADPLAAVPASASRSAAGLNAYLRSLAAAASADQAEPALLTDFAPPLPEDAEPEPMS